VKVGCLRSLIAVLDRSPMPRPSSDGPILIGFKTASKISSCDLYFLMSRGCRCQTHRNLLSLCISATPLRPILKHDFARIRSPDRPSRSD